MSTVITGTEVTATDEDLSGDNGRQVEVSGGNGDTTSRIVDFQNVTAGDPVDTGAATSGGGTIASNAPAGAPVIDGVYFNSGAGNDAIAGSGANDFIRAGAGDDIINTGDGDDVVRGGSGSDTITLGGGADTVYYTIDQLDGSTDTVTDFSSDDKISLDSDVSASISGNVITLTGADGRTSTLLLPEGQDYEIDDDGDIVVG
ncbi:calcium-binding protein [Synechococcus sp. RSCCF101]|uniref:calcium-binding protein n=1 Tax=Synechococcus sp. RSCCF101 TaxID=2511069 RepID=UPI0012480269|nr:calcium-binding protein [Synechococcus sp. RSCCF101]QEY32408.1 calcium-binding protein [Synechococcus sp. RSCCF101]